MLADKKRDKTAPGPPVPGLIAYVTGKFSPLFFFKPCIILIQIDREKDENKATEQPWRVRSPFILCSYMRPGYKARTTHSRLPL